GADRLHQSRVGMAESGDGDTGEHVEIGVAVDVPDGAALATVEHQRRDGPVGHEGGGEVVLPGHSDGDGSGAKPVTGTAVPWPTQLLRGIRWNTSQPTPPMYWSSPACPERADRRPPRSSRT